MIRRGVRKIFLLIGLIFAVPISVNAAEFNFQTASLDNGMRVVVIPNHRVPVVAHMVWYGVGAMDELNGKSGLAHFLEHLMFKGTPDAPDGEFSRRIARMGGNENAFTTTDYTVYFQQISRERLNDVMRLEADRMQNLSFSKTAFDSEKKVILEERRARIDNNPSAILAEEMSAALFRNHPYGRPLIGWEHEIQSLAYEDAMEFYRRYYAPNNAILIIAGDAEWNDIQSDVEKIYGVIESRPIIRITPPTEPEQRVNRTITYTNAKVKQPQFSRYIQMPSQYTATDRKLVRATELLAEILGGGNDSHLHNKMVRRDKIAVAASSYYVSDKRGPSIFGLSITPSSKYDRVTIEKAVESAIGEIAQNGISANELRRFKNSFIAESVYARDSNFRMAHLAGETIIQGGSLADIQKWDDDIESLTIEDLQNAARKLLSSPHVDGWLMPVAETKHGENQTDQIELPAGSMR